MISRLLSRAYANAPFMLCLATLGWGGNTIASRMAVGEVAPMMLIFLRWGLVVGLILATHNREMIRAWPVMKGRLHWILLMGGCGMTLFNALFYIAAHSTTAVNLGIIQSTMPGMILLGSFFLFGSRINLVQFAGLVLTLIGVSVIITRGSVENLLLLSFNVGDLLMLLACGFYSSYTIGLKNRPEVSGMVMMGYFSIAAFLITIPLVIIEDVFWGAVMPGWEGWLIIFYIAIMPSFLSQVFFMRGVDLIGPGSAGLYTNLVPVFSSIMAIALLGEVFRWYHLLAMLLVFGGISLFENQNRKRNPKT